MPNLASVLSIATCFLCAILLFRGYMRTHARLLLWSALCFTGLVIENAILYFDMTFIPEISLSILRKAVGLLSMSLLIFGLIWDSK
jgi:hypothetical protein